MCFYRVHRMPCRARGTPCNKTPLKVTNASLTRGALRALRELAHAPRAQVAHRAVVCTCSVCCRMPTSTDTMHFQVRCTAAALNHAHAHWLACVCMKAQRTPSRSKMTICARCVPIFLAHLPPLSQRSTTDFPPPCRSALWWPHRNVSVCASCVAASIK